MAVDALGIVNFEESNVYVEGMSWHRTIPAFSFLGRYRIIDFVLSNMVNSGIDHIMVLVNDKPRSIIEHIGSGDQYNINSKKGSLEILYPDNLAGHPAYNTDVFLLNQNLSKLEEAKNKYVVIAPSYMIYTIDFSDVISEHEASGADITMVYREENHASQHFVGCQMLTLDENGRVTDMATNRAERGDHQNIFMDAYVMKKETLIELIKSAKETSAFFNLKDTVKNLRDQLVIKTYKYEDEVFCINSIQEYFHANMELINYTNAKHYFKDEWPIYTTTFDNPPTLYSPEAEVINCSVSNGCKISGKVENCVIGRGVIIEKGAYVKNSLIMSGAYVGADAVILDAVVDKYAKIINKKEVIGDADLPLYVGRGEII